MNASAGFRAGPMASRPALPELERSEGCGCPDSDELRLLVEETLPADEQARVESHLLECEACRLAVNGQRSDEDLFRDVRAARADIAAEPTLEGIQGYESFGELHRGGQGVVFKALQRATKRIVAVKLLLHGAHATPRQRLRFEREIDLAAQLRHPNIVTIHDSGVAVGRPYLVMEFIDGLPLDEFVRTRSPSIPERLKLFRSLCDAVGYAHLRGVIHRDLKPGNVLIDADGRPHVLDFGLAKETAPDDEAPLTATGEFLGTLAYAAPEQTLGDPHLTDTRTDVYSLGVILHEMLTGSLPYAVHGSLATALANIATAEASPPSRLNPAVDADVDTIVLKALAKEPDRRYASAVELGRDVERYLAGEPIDARRDSLAYLLNKAVRRNRATLATAAAFVVLLAVGLVASLTFWRQAVADADRAKQAEGEEHLARIEEGRARDAERMQREEAEWQAYVANLVAANAALDHHDIVAARPRLEAAPAHLRNWEWGWLHSRLDGSRRTFTGHTSYVEAVAFSPDGRRLASASWDKTVRVWDPISGATLATYKAPAEVWTLAHHPRTALLALGCWDGCVRLWDHVTCEVRDTLRGPGTDVWAVAFNADGSLLAAACRDKGNGAKGGIRVWRTDGMEEATTFDMSQPAQGLAFHPDGRRLVSATPVGIQTWDLGTGQESKDKLAGISFASALAIDGTGSQMAIGERDLSISIRNGATGKELRRLRGHTQLPVRLAFSPDGTRLVSAGRDKTIRLWDTARGVELAVLHGHDWTVSALAYSPDGTTIASGGWDHAVKLWSASGEGAAVRLSRHQDRVLATAWHPDADTLASGGRDGSVVVGSFRGGAGGWRAEHAGAVHAVAFNRSGTILATASADRTAALWDVGTGRRIHVHAGHTDAVHSVAFSADGARLITGSRDNTLRVWDVAGGQSQAVLAGHDDHVHTVAVSADGRRLGSIGHNSLRVWNAATLKEAARFPRRIFKEDFALAFLPDDNRVVAGLDERTIGVWNLSENRLERELHGHSDEIRSVVISPDGTRLISSSFDGTVRVWDVATGAELAHTTAPVFSVSFCPMGIRLAAGSGDGTVTVWSGTPKPPGVR